MLRYLLKNKILNEEKICISEILPQNVDFLVLEILQIVENKSLFSFNECEDHYNNILKKRRIRDSVVLGSTYNELLEFTVDDSEIEKYLIVDDIYTGKHLFNTTVQPKIAIFRSGSIKKIDYYNYDVIVQVEPLPSGCSTEYDGIINIFNRGGNIGKLKYKIEEDNTRYYEY